MTDDFGAPAVKPCPMSGCGQMGRFMQLASYAVPDGDGGEVEIPNAKIVECPVHGVRPADKVENKRWQRLVYMQHAPEGPAKDQCDNCLKPRAMCGQMYYYGVAPDYVRLCGECNELIDYRTLTPVRADD